MGIEGLPKTQSPKAEQEQGEVPAENPKEQQDQQHERAMGMLGVLLDPGHTDWARKEIITYDPELQQTLAERLYAERVTGSGPNTFREAGELAESLKGYPFGQRLSELLYSQ